MKGFIKLILSAISGVLLLEACVPEPLNIKNVPVLQPHIVVSSQVVPGQSIAVLLTKSIGALDAGSTTSATTLLQSIVINDALVTLSYPGKTDTLLFIAEGVYGSMNTTLVVGQEYNLKVVSPSMGTVTASTFMKPEIKFRSVNATLSISGNDTLATVVYSFDDPVGKDWYMINVQRFRSGQDLSQTLNPRMYTELIKDDDFDGKTDQNSFTVPFRRFTVGDTVAVSLTNISEDYFNYLFATKDRNSISALVSDPLNLPSNVKDGYGFFNMQWPDVRVFQMK